MDDGYPYPYIFAAGAVLLVLFLYLAWRYWKNRKEDLTEEAIMTMVNEGHEQGVLESNEAEMITNIFEFHDKDAGDIMTPRKNMIALDGSMTLKDAAQFVLKEGNNSRYPVYGKDMDDIIGTLHMRDILVRAANEQEADLSVASVPGLLREAYCIPETKSLHSVFKEMQSKKIQMEIVVDEYGQTAGLVTMEDILEEIVGNILDEYDVDEEYIIQESEDVLIMSGMTPLRDVQEVLDITLDEADQESFDTLNGLLISRFGRIPDREETPETSFLGYQFQVIRMEDKIIHSVRVKKISESGSEEGQPGQEAAASAE